MGHGLVEHVTSPRKFCGWHRRRVATHPGEVSRKLASGTPTTCSPGSADSPPPSARPTRTSLAHWRTSSAPVRPVRRRSWQVLGRRLMTGWTCMGWASTTGPTHQTTPRSVSRVVPAAPDHPIEPTGRRPVGVQQLTMSSDPERPPRRSGPRRRVTADGPPPPAPGLSRLPPPRVTVPTAPPPPARPSRRRAPDRPSSRATAPRLVRPTDCGRRLAGGCAWLSTPAAQVATTLPC